MNIHKLKQNQDFAKYLLKTKAGGKLKIFKSSALKKWVGLVLFKPRGKMGLVSSLQIICNTV